MTKLHPFQVTFFALSLTSVSFSSCSHFDEPLFLEPLFGKEAWYDAGLAPPIFDEASFMHASSHTPRDDLHTDPASSTPPVDGDIHPKPVAQVTARQKRIAPEDRDETQKEQAHKRFRSYTPLQHAQANDLYERAIGLLEQDAPENLEECLSLFLNCYQNNTGYRWKACLGVACTYLKMGNTAKALYYIKRILKSKSCPKATIKADAQIIIGSFSHSPAM